AFPRLRDGARVGNIGTRFAPGSSGNARLEVGWRHTLASTAHSARALREVHIRVLSKSSGISKPMADLQVGRSSRRPTHRRHLHQITHVVRIVASTGGRWLARQEAAVLVAVLVVLLAVFGFVRIAEELGGGELAKLDEWLLELLRVPGEPHHPVGPPWLMEAAQDITVLGGRTKVYLIAVALFATLVVGISRVYLGVHYPSDVLAGWCAGLVWSLICWLVARYLQYRGTVERSGRI